MRSTVVPRESRRRSLAVGAGSSLILAVVVFLVPVWLVGNGLVPLRSVQVNTGGGLLGPSPATVAVHLTVQAGLIAAWLCWAWLVVCVAVEVRMRLTGRSTARTWGGGGLPVLAAFLVSGVFALSALARTPGSPLPRPAAAAPAAGPADGPAQAARVRSDRPVRSEAPRSFPGEGDVGLGSGDGERIHVVGPRQTLWSIAEGALGSGTRWREIAERNYGIIQPDGRSLTPAHQLAVGWRLALPAGTGPSGPRRPDPPVDPRSVTPIGAGVIGIGVLDLAERWRQVRRRSTNGGAPGRAGSDEVFEARLRHGSAEGALALAHAAIAAWGAPGLSSGGRPPVVAVHVGEVQVTVTVAGPVDRQPLPPGFATTAADRASIPRNLLAAGRVGRGGVVPEGRARPVLVAMATMGAEVAFVDLGAVGPVVMVAEDLEADGVARAMALELATSPRSTGMRLLLHGFGAELTRFPGVELLAAEDVATLVGRPSVGSRRPEGATVVICAPGTGDEVVGPLVAYAAAGSDLAVVMFTTDPTTPGLPARADEGARCTGRPALRVTAAGWTVLPPVGTPDTASVGPVELQTVSTGDVAAVLEYLDQSRPGSGARPGQVVPFRDPGTDRTVQRVPTPDGRSDCRAQADGTGPPPSGGTHDTSGIEIAVLGPVEVRGADRPFTRAWARELVVYLALHPDGVENDRWMTALWPDRLMAPSSLHSTVSVARRALGRAADGSDHLPRSHGRLAVGPSVTTDWAEFRRLAETEAPANWREALTLVRGRPFDGLRSSDWAVLDGTAPLIEATVVDTAGRLAGACFRDGDAPGMEWAARRGLLVSPYDERLYRMLLRAADLAGNPAGVEAVMAELVHVAGDEGDPMASVHPSTVALYRSLSRRPPAGSAPRAGTAVRPAG